MRKYHIPAVLVFVMLTASLARADGLIYKLPEDGTWATYQMDTTMSVGDVVLEKVNSTIRVASVGKVMENDKLCRWIEISGKTRRETKLHAPEGETRVVVRKPIDKVLIPEEHLGKGKTPLDHFIRGWKRRSEKGERQKMSSLSSNNRRALTLILSDPLRDAKPLPRVEVESKLGKVLCNGVAGSLDIDLMSRTRRAMLEDRLHADAPFGLVSSHGYFETELMQEVGEIKEGIVRVEWDITLSDFGDNATSEMPDAK
jgi:hypothetical protein